MCAKFDACHASLLGKEKFAETTFLVKNLNDWNEYENKFWRAKKLLKCLKDEKDLKELMHFITDECVLTFEILVIVETALTRSINLQLKDREANFQFVSILCDFVIDVHTLNKRGTNLHDKTEPR